MLRRIASGAVAVIAVLAAYSCGSSGTDTSVGTDTRGRAAALVPADAAATANGLRTVTYQGVAFDVPPDWPVYDLAVDPTTCVRFDVHAVYLGAPGADMACPAGIAGRADAVLVEPAQGSNNAGDEHGANGSVAATTDSGLNVQVADRGPAASEIDATISSAAVDVTLTYQNTDATVQQILRSFRAADR